MFHILFSLLRAKYIFFWFYQSVWFEAENVLVERDYVISREINTVLKMAVFGKSCWNVDTWKMLLSVLKRYFFGFIEALASKGILNAIKKMNYISHGVRWPCSSHFRYVTNEIICNFASSSYGFGHMKRILSLFFQSELGVLKKN